MLTFAACGQTEKTEEMLPETAEKALSYCPVMPTDHIGRETVIEARANKYAGTSRIVILREGEA